MRQVWPTKEISAPGGLENPVVESLERRSVLFCHHHCANFTSARSIELVARLSRRSDPCTSWQRPTTEMARITRYRRSHQWLSYICSSSHVLSIQNFLH